MNDIRNRIAIASVCRATLIASLLGAFVAVSARAAAHATVFDPLPTAVRRLNLQPLGRLADTTQLRLSVCLPIRNRQALTALVDQISNPASPSFRRYLTPAQLTQQFCPTEQDYQAVIRFAEENRLAVRSRYANRLLLDISGTVPDIETAFHVALRTYQHPKASKQFFAPDAQPWVDASVPIFSVNGLDNYSSPPPPVNGTPAARQRSPRMGAHSPADSGFYGAEFRRAYIPDVTLTGAGQSLGLLERDGYLPWQITEYESIADLAPVPLENVLLDGVDGRPDTIDYGVIVTANIQMAIAMAPGLDRIVVFEGTNPDHLLNSMLSRYEIKQFASGWTGSFSSAQVEGFALLMAAQGQSLFWSSGIWGAAFDSLCSPTDAPHLTTVGGTELQVDPSGAYASETVNPPSGGGISQILTIPPYQQGINMTACGGSTSMRNVPDVAIVSYPTAFVLNVFDPFEWGTDLSISLWAAFAALVNQQAAILGQPPVGFLNPALYEIASGPLYGSCFHDITVGHSEGLHHNSYYAVPGYDLCTGLGTPQGALIPALLRYSGAVWVDYNYTGTVEDGSFEAPYKTLAQAVTAVAPGGRILFKTAGSEFEQLTILKSTTIGVTNGPVTVDGR